jgi:hypothetical protein
VALVTTGDPRQTLLATMAHNQAVAAASSPFYADLIERMSADVRESGPTWRLLERYADEPPTEYFPFRALAGVHLEVLEGKRPGLDAAFPGDGNPGDVERAWPLVREAFGERDPEVVAELRHPLQTNEPSRCAALIGGFCEVARATGLPIRALELGSSAGLNLNFDRYRYEAGDVAFGPADSPVRMADRWTEGVPDLGAPLTVAERAGCDLAPLDIAAERDRLELEACIWPDEFSRMAELRAAAEVAAAHPPQIERASADEWIASMLAEPVAGMATVVFHSIFWPYLPATVADAIRAAVTSAGERAGAEAPVAWMRFEPGDEPALVELRLTAWPGGGERLLGTGGFHQEPVRWLA